MTRQEWQQELERYFTVAKHASFFQNARVELNGRASDSVGHVVYTSKADGEWYAFRTTHELIDEGGRRIFGLWVSYDGYGFVAVTHGNRKATVFQVGKARSGYKVRAIGKAA